MKNSPNNYDIFTGEDLKIADLIQRRRLQLLVHSCIYYEMDYNLISDKKWDEWARELVQLQRDYPEISEQVRWYEAFKDWDASTGAFLPIRDEWVIRKAQMLGGKAGKQTVKKQVVKPKSTVKKKRKLF